MILVVGWGLGQGRGEMVVVGGSEEIACSLVCFGHEVDGVTLIGERLVGWMYRRHSDPYSGECMLN